MTLRVRRRIESETLHIPELRQLMGQDVEIVVIQMRDDPAEVKETLKGSVLRDPDPFGPAAGPEDWEADA